VRSGILHHASGVRPSKSLVVRGGLVRTFGGLVGFLVVTFLCGGLYILEDAFANPLHAGSAAVISAAFIITLAAVLLRFLIGPGKWLRTMNPDCSVDSEVPAVKSTFDRVGRGSRQDILRNNLPYQRFYVDHSRIRP